MVIRSVALLFTLIFAFPSLASAEVAARCNLAASHVRPCCRERRSNTAGPCVKMSCCAVRQGAVVPAELASATVLSQAAAVVAPRSVRVATSVAGLAGRFLGAVRIRAPGGPPLYLSHRRLVI